MTAADWSRILLLASVWGCSFLFIEIALRAEGPFTIVLARVFLAAVALLIYCRIRNIRIDVSPGSLRDYLVMGVIANVAPFSLIAIGQTQISSGLASIFIATTPLLTVVVAHLWGRHEPATAARVAGTVIGLAGVAVLMGTNVLQADRNELLGELALFGAALCYAVFAVYGRRFRHQHPAANAAAMVLAACPVTALLAFGLETPFSTIPATPALLSMVALGLLSTGFAYILYFTILANAGATNAMLVTLIQPPVAIMLGVVVLGEMLEPPQFLGLLLIALGLALVDGRALRLLRRQDAT